MHVCKSNIRIYYQVYIAGLMRPYLQCIAGNGILAFNKPASVMPDKPQGGHGNEHFDSSVLVAARPVAAVAVADMQNAAVHLRFDQGDQVAACFYFYFLGVSLCDEYIDIVSDIYFVERWKYSGISGSFARPLYAIPSVFFAAGIKKQSGHTDSKATYYRKNIFHKTVVRR
jgi:hypothetical protein